MCEKQFIDFNQVGNQMFDEAIKLDCGVCRHLYHGTTKYLANLIKETNEIIISNEIGYLGYGFYCYLFDAEASRIYAKAHHNEKIAVLELVVNLGNVFFINQELYKFFLSYADKLTVKKELRKKVGTLIELFIKEIIIPDYKIDVNAVAQIDIYDKKRVCRPVFMCSIRNVKMIKKIQLYWEEK
jgi:hypothetical protein